MNFFIQQSSAILSQTPTSFKRFLYDWVNLDGQLTGIIGPRGVGKSVLVRQLAQRYQKTEGEVLYLSLDHPYFSRHSLYDLALAFYNRGGGLLVLDEADKYSRLLPDLKALRQASKIKILFAASSVGDESGIIYDLSREATLYALPGMSFREHLNFRHDLAFPPFKLDDLLDYNRNPVLTVLNRIKPLQYFDDYLKYGFYPIQESSSDQFEATIIRFANEAISYDVMAAYHMDYDSVAKLKGLLTYIAESGPVKPHIQNLANELGSTRDSVLKFMRYLHKGGLINLLNAEPKDISYSRKADLLFIGNPNLLYSSQVDRYDENALYQTFLMSQLTFRESLHLVHDRTWSLNLDTLLQLKFDATEPKQALQQSRPVYQIDPNREDQAGSKLPLWAFGFLY